MPPVTVLRPPPAAAAAEAPGSGTRRVATGWRIPKVATRNAIRRNMVGQFPPPGTSAQARAAGHLAAPVREAPHHSRRRTSHDQHGIAVGIEAVTLRDRVS